MLCVKHLYLTVIYSFNSDPYDELDSDEEDKRQNGSALIDIDLGLTAFVSNENPTDIIYN